MFVIILWASELCKERKSGEETASYFVQGKDSIIKQNRAAIIMACPVDWKLWKSPLKSEIFFPLEILMEINDLDVQIGFIKFVRIKYGYKQGLPDIIIITASMTTAAATLMCVYNE